MTGVEFGPRLAGRTAIVTGAAQGIGAAMVRLFHRHGARVVAVDLRADLLEHLDAECPGLVPVAADVSSSADADRIMAAAGERLDIVCNNAGILDGLALVDEVTEEQWERVMAVNLRGPFLLCRRAVPVMTRQGKGVILNTASVAGLRGGRAGAAYTAAKFGLVGLTQNIAAAHGRDGIRCNAICPGSVLTNVMDGVELSPRGALLPKRDQGKPAPASPEEIAAAALFLVSDEASNVNGVALPVDGGYLAF
ncbi:MAG TPA: SDR family oxidoreductase [Acidimicrobiia bacterium]|nr:SDR family oxidoreductase [Acidimicrobiia bacterium]